KSAGASAACGGGGEKSLGGLEPLSRRKRHVFAGRTCEEARDSGGKYYSRWRFDGADRSFRAPGLAAGGLRRNVLRIFSALLHRNSRHRRTICRGAAARLSLRPRGDGRISAARNETYLPCET